MEGKGEDISKGKGRQIMERGEGEIGEGERWLESAAAPVQFDSYICRRRYYVVFHATLQNGVEKENISD